jgi:hypothetical protein
MQRLYNIVPIYPLRKLYPGKNRMVLIFPKKSVPNPCHPCSIKHPRSHQIITPSYASKYRSATTCAAKSRRIIPGPCARTHARCACAACACTSPSATAVTDKAVTQKLVNEAYERMKEEVNAAHILIKCDAKADPKDTLAAYNRIMDIRRRILAGESFEKSAKENSEDPSAKFNDGNLGYFTAMQMVYPFEDAAYKTAKGSISNPVRTQFGYHILKVMDRRASQGQITVAHIMVRANPGMPAEDSIAARKKIYDIYDRLRAGGNFAALALEFSDHTDSKTKGGALPVQGVV